MVKICLFLCWVFLQFGQPCRAQGRAQGWPSRAPGRPRELASRPRLGSRLAASATMTAPCAGQVGLGWGQGWALCAKGFQASLGAGLQARKAGFSAQVRNPLQMVTFPHPLKGVVFYLLKDTLEHVFPLSPPLLQELKSYRSPNPSTQTR